MDEKKKTKELKRIRVRWSPSKEKRQEWGNDYLGEERQGKGEAFSCPHTIFHYKSFGNEYLLGQKKAASVPTWELLTSRVTWITFKWRYEVNVSGVSNECQVQCPPGDPLPPLFSPTFQLLQISHFYSGPFFPNISWVSSWILVNFFVFPFSHISKRRMRSLLKTSLLTRKSKQAQ